HPDGPTMQTKSPGHSTRLTGDSARTASAPSPNCFETLSRTSLAWPRRSGLYRSMGCRLMAAPSRHPGHEAGIDVGPVIGRRLRDLPILDQELALRAQGAQYPGIARPGAPHPVVTEDFLGRQAMERTDIRAR